MFILVCVSKFESMLAFEHFTSYHWYILKTYMFLDLLVLQKNGLPIVHQLNHTFCLYSFCYQCLLLWSIILILDSAEKNMYIWGLALATTCIFINFTLLFKCIQLYHMLCFNYNLPYTLVLCIYSHKVYCELLYGFVVDQNNLVFPHNDIVMLTPLPLY